MLTATAVFLPTDEPHHLFHRYDGQIDPQPCHLTIDLDNGAVTCDWNRENGPAVPASVHHRHVLWLTIPPLVTRYANQLITEALPYAQRILDGSEIVWNGDNHVGQLNDAASAAVDELEAHIARNYANDDRTGMVIEQMYAGSWFTDPEQDADTLGVSADTSDADLPAAAARFEKLLRADTDPNTVIAGTLEAVTRLRDDLRTAMRDELAEVAAELRRLVARRAELIQAARGWGDSLRAIAGLADLSHNRVDQIAQVQTHTMGTGNVNHDDVESLNFADESDWMDDEDETTAGIHPAPCGYPDVIPCICPRGVEE
jgi:hypothetical protein